MFAFLPTLGFGEMFLLVVVGLLLYGRNLPQAGRTMGRFVAQLKRGFDDFKAQMDRDESLREVRKTFEDTTREMRNITALPRAIANPVQGVQEFARDALTHTNEPASDATEISTTTTADAEDRPDEPPPPPTTDAPEHRTASNPASQTP